MDKGFNTEVENARKDLAKLINEKLQLGIPFSVVSLIIENVLVEVRNGVEKSLQQEADKYNELTKIQAEQVEWVEPTPENQE